MIGTHTLRSSASRLALLTSRAKVLDVAKGRVVIERGSIDAIKTPRRIAILAQFSVSVDVSRSFRRLVSELAARGYQTVIVSACEVGEPLEWNGDLPSDAIVIRQPNLGYDFGSWAIGLNLLDSLASAPYVILANDSLLGPFGSLEAILANFEGTGADTWALTDTYQNFHHLQSYFLGFRNGVLQDAPLRGFFRGIRLEATKWDIIRRNELGLSKLLHDEGYSATAAFRADSVVGPGENPVIKGWSELLARGFPFVKREIVREPAVAPRSRFVASEVAALYGATLEEWL